MGLFLSSGFSRRSVAAVAARRVGGPQLLEVEVASGKEHTAKHAAPGLWLLLDLERAMRGALVAYDLSVCIL